MTVYLAATAVAWLALVCLLLAVTHRVAVNRDRLDAEAETEEAVQHFRSLKSEFTGEREAVACDTARSL
jgi:hypothetical protein